MLPELLVPSTIARLDAQVPSLGGRVKPAGNLVALMRSGELRQPQISAWVIPSALIGRAASASAGAFVQPVERGVTVMINVPAYDGTGAGGSDQLEELVMAVIMNLCGWSPVNSPGVFQLSRGQLLRMEGGSIVYQIDLSIADQLRTSP